MRLGLSPLRVDDAPEMASVLADPALYEHTGGAPESAAELALRYARWVKGPPQPGTTWLNLRVCERSSEGAVGYVQATIKPTFADVAWVIGTPWQGRGYATEAARALLTLLAREHAVTTARALIRASHPASQRVAMRLGLERTNEHVDGEEVWLGPTSHPSPPQPSTRTPG